MDLHENKISVKRISYVKVQRNYTVWKNKKLLSLAPGEYFVKSIGTMIYGTQSRNPPEYLKSGPPETDELKARLPRLSTIRHCPCKIGNTPIKKPQKLFENIVIKKELDHFLFLH